MEISTDTGVLEHHQIEYVFSYKYLQYPTLLYLRSSAF